ncbi:MULTISPECIES: phosphotransferase [Trueperella]|uniref:Aminoglycoside phosphotransferase n=1 Tax=Trueperella abortisuis TaxID=445930 RepID=A0ABT9PIS2_9ACTO|nr:MULTISPECIES: phosphotransferase [Trueperella]MCI7305216.1 phosphotransferase [Trueperella sp.]MDP9831860.1 aminoglycoside phosphotransferase [Trueperella abortisuis]MDY5402749.1 phosphotransferase [Trueperella sp.]
MTKHAERRAVALLTGPSAGEMLSLALSPGIVRAWRLRAVNHRPGAGVSVGYSVTWDEVRHKSSAREVRERQDGYIVASTAKISRDRLDDAGAITLYADDLPVHVWEFPGDPELPALADACDPEAMAQLVGECDVELLGYRPTRRAVLRVQGASGVHYTKVVRPNAVDGLVGRHRACAEAGLPVPRVVACRPDGLVVTSSVGGTPLAVSFQSGRDLPAIFRSLTSTLDALPPAALDLPYRPAWAERCEHYARAAGAAMPELAGRAGDLAAGILRVRKSAHYGPLVSTHGDFYEANVLVSGGRVSGLLDLDSLGPGYRADDWGCLLGHLSVLPGLSEKYAGARRIQEDWYARAAHDADPAAIAASAAGVVLSLVASTRQRGRSDWKDQARCRLEVAEDWLARAR